MSNNARMASMIGGGLLSATLSLLPLFSFPGLMFLSYLTTLPLFLVGLSLGLHSLYGAGALATLVVILLGGPWSGGEFLILSAFGSAFLTLDFGHF